MQLTNNPVANLIKIFHKYAFRPTISILIGSLLGHLAEWLDILVRANAFHQSFASGLLLSLFPIIFGIWIWDLMQEGVELKKVSTLLKIYWCSSPVLVIIAFIIGVLG